MSIYYNVSVNANRDKNQFAALVENNNNEFVVDKQDEYQVGVCRFKIPLGLIDMYRIYSEEFNLGVNIPTVIDVGDSGDSSKFAELASNIMGRPSGITHDQIVGNHYPLGVDSDRNSLPFISIQDDYHYCKWLNKGILNLQTPT